MTVPFVLHGSPHSQFTYKVGLMLRLAGLKFEFRHVSFRKGMHRTPEFLKLSRWGQVPVLVHGETVLLQSGAILEYLAGLTQSFTSTDPAEQRQIREWLYWSTDRLAPPVYRLYGFWLGKKGLLPIEADAAVENFFQRRLVAELGVLDSELGQRNCLVGSRPTIADLCCYGDVVFAALAEIDLSRWANINKWSRRIEALADSLSPFELLHADTTR
jgi:glutathione S-transferase